MAKMKDNEGRCVLTLPLKTELWQEHIIEKRFAIMESLKNQLIAKELRKLRNLERTKAYRELQQKIEETPKDDRKPLYALRAQMLKDAGFSEFDFISDMGSKKSDMPKHFREHIAVHIAHSAASDVWRAFEDFLFRDGREVHFQKRGTLESVASKENGGGMTYKNSLFIWSHGRIPGPKPKKDKFILQISVVPPRNEYEREMLKKPIQNMRILRRWMKTKYKYYLQLVLLGEPVKKERKTGRGRVGIDIGPQTVAVASKNKVMLLELADRIDRNHQKKTELQRKMARSRFYSNPEYFNPDGTIRRLPRGERRRWKSSNEYRRLAGKVRELERKNAAIRKYQHTCLANEILSLGNEIFVENTNFTSWQRRAKETKTDENGRYLKKKRFGKSLANKAPATLLLILKTKAERVGASYHEIDTQKYKASQFDHTNGEYRESLLRERCKELSDGSAVQRDLYSAFLLMNTDTTTTTVAKTKKGKVKSGSYTYCKSDPDLCKKNFKKFSALQKQEIERILNQNVKYPSSFGDLNFLLARIPTKQEKA